jgi:hypothetical protein
MPKPLIILDHHYLSAPQEFLITHFSELKKLGYKKILLEMDQNISFANLKLNLNQALKPSGHFSPADKLLYSLRNLLNAIEENEFICEFIDPESMTEAEKFDKAVSRAKDQIELKRIRELREQTTRVRDEYMAKRVLAESVSLEGAVITFVGFKHIELLRQLTASGLDHVALLVDDSVARNFDVLPGTSGLEKHEWLQMSNPAFRDEHYGQSVNYLDWVKAKTVPFFALKAMLKLTHEFECHHRPLVADAISSDAILKIDEAHHVQAYLPKDQEKGILTKFPGLVFFKMNDQLCIPGINLQQQQEPIVRVLTHERFGKSLGSK